MPSTFGPTDLHLPRYEIQGWMGEGASAVVYRAWDVELKRPVALKVLREVSALTRERFRREAQAAAQISHPNVVSVYDAGEHEGKLYLVMELVEGKSLQDLLKAVPPEPMAAVALLEKVARGVAAAHARGIVHRDLKPGNIIMTATGEPKVADFGLAHLPDATLGLTATGAVLGTPLYMSPEQVQGGEASLRTDVYALGAILYQLLTGRPPHTSEQVPELYRRIVREEPAPPRQLAPAVSVDLERIVLKALDHEPSRRYADAGALAEELLRLREGRPVEARAESVGRRIYKGLRRHRALVMVAAAAVAWLGVFAVGWSLHRAKEEQLARERGEALVSLRQTARISVDAALRLRRAGDAAGMKRFLPPLEEAYGRASRLSPETAEADYLLGRMYRALMDDGKALDHQERALGKDGDYAPAVYERVVLKARRYDSLFRAATESMRGQAIHQLTSQGGRPGRVPTRVEVEQLRPEIRALRESIIADCGHLKHILKSQAVQPWIGAAHTLAADGILAFCEQRYEEGRARLAEAVAQEGQLEEAWEALARVIEGQEAAVQSPMEREGLRREAERVYGDALFLDQAYLPFYLGRGNTFMRESVAKFRSGRDALGEYASAEKDFLECVRIDPGHAEAWQRLGSARLDRARALLARGRDPLPDWQEALRDFDRSIGLRKDAMMPWTKRGFLRTLLGSSETDPTASWEKAESDLMEALRIQTGNTDPWLRLGILRTLRGQRELDHGGDPLPMWATAELNLSEALRIAPGYSEALTRRGALRHSRGLYRKSKGGDPLPDWDLAEADLTEALETEDLYAESRALRGVVRTHRGLERIQKGVDPLPDWLKAEEDFRLASEDGLVLAGAHQGWGDLAWQRAEFSEAKSKESYALCAREYAEAIRLNPRLEALLASRLKRAEAHSSP